MFEQAAAELLAWQSIDAEKVTLNLDEHNKALATTKAADADRTLRLRVRESYVWCLVPVQPAPLGAISFDALRVEGGDPLAIRVANKLKNQGYVNLAYPPELLRSLLDNVLASLWADGHVSVNGLWESFSKYPYLPRLAGIDVLSETVKQGAAQVLWEHQGWGVAQGYDQATGRYLGLVAGDLAVTVTGTSVLVAPARARAQLDADQRQASQPSTDGAPVDTAPDTTTDVAGGTGTGVAEVRKRRFFGVVEIDPERPAREFTKVTDEVIGQLARVIGTRVTIRVEVEATNDEGFDAKVVRDISENAITLKFEQYGFE